MSYRFRGLGAAYSVPGNFTRIFDGRYQVEFDNPDGSKTSWITSQATLPSEMGNTSFVFPPSSTWRAFLNSLPADPNITNWATGNLYEAQYRETGVYPALVNPMSVGWVASPEYKQMQANAVSASNALIASAKTQATVPKPLTPGPAGIFDLSKIPLWGWAVAAGVAVFAFGGARGR